MAAFLLLVVLAAGCDLVRLQHGRVVGCNDHRPIDGAAIEQTDVGAPSKRTFARTGPDGTYSIAVPGSNAVHQTTTAPGRRQDDRELPNTREEAEGVNHTICLAPAGAPP